MLQEILNAASGGLAKEVFDTVKAYFPPGMSEEQKAQAQLALVEVERQREKDTQEAALGAQKALTEQIAALEGTASDLKALPVLGPVMLFLRGSQRPLWGFATMWIDFQVFSGAWKLVEGSQTEAAFWVLNLLVLPFLFGERTLKNLMPLIERLIKK